MKLTEEDITLTDNGCILIKVDGYGHVEEQLKSRILRSLRLMELVDKEYDYGHYDLMGKNFVDRNDNEEKINKSIKFETITYE